MPVQTLPELFLTAIREKPRPDCFSHRDESGKYVDVSSTEIHRRVRALRFGLRSLGVRKGDRIALLSENRLEWALADLATLCCGAVTVPIYPTLLPDTIDFILKDCAPKVAFVSTAEQAEKISQLRGGLDFLQDVITFETTDAPQTMTIAKLMQIGENIIADNPPEPKDEIEDVDADDTCSIIYTSGTTGQPKGVVLTHRNFVSNVLNVEKIVDIGPEDRCLSFLPLSHVLERMAGYYLMLHKGVGIAYAEAMDTVAADLVEVKPTIAVSVPRLYEKIYARVLAMALAGSFIKKNIFFWARRVGLEYGKCLREGGPISAWLSLKFRIADKLVFAKLRARTGGNMRFFVSGGAPLSPTINEFFYAAGMMILEGYGLTETSPVLAVNTVEHFRIGSVGPAIPETEIRIAEDGEILARGPQVMPGYFNNEEATREVLDEEGWFSTGDIGHLDDEGYLFITDRKKDLIVTAGGKNIAPQPIENTFVQNKFFTQVLVVGDRKPYLSALFVPSFDSLEEYARKRNIAYDSIEGLVRDPKIVAMYGRQLDRVNAKLPAFNQVKKFVLLERELTLEEGELTPTMKVKRRVVEKKFAAEIASLYPTELE